MQMRVHTPQPDRVCYGFVLYYRCENRNPERDAAAPGICGVLHGQRCQTTAGARTRRSGHSLAGPSEDLDKDFSECQGAQNSVQDARERLAVLLDARPAVDLQRQPFVSHLEDWHSPPAGSLQWALAFSAAHHFL